MKSAKSMTVGNIIVISLLAVLFFQTGFAETEAAARETFELEIWSSRTGTRSYTFGVGFADLINKNSDWVKATAIESAGPSINLKMMATKPEARKKTIYVTENTMKWAAERNMGVFKNMEYDWSKERYLSIMGPVVNYLLTYKPNVKSTEDLGGMRISIEEKVNVTTVAAYQGMLEAAGVLDKVKLEYMSYKGGLDALRDGTLDATMGANAPRDAAMSIWSSHTCEELSIGARTCNAVDWGIENFNKMLRKTSLPVIAMTIPAGQACKATQHEIVGLGRIMGWGADIELPEDVAYEVARIYYENALGFKKYWPTSVLTPEMVGGWNASDKDIHPGALKFYREKGLKTTLFGR